MIPSGAPRLETLGLRHVRFGYFALLVFLTLGLGLEALHGFKVGLYLDVANEPRRLAFRLAHAHGALLGLLNVVFGLTLVSRFAPPAATARKASRLLSVATLALPGGFFLGGFFVHGGDPGLGVLLVPLGAVTLLGAVLLTARGASDGGALAELREIRYDSPDYDASVSLRCRVLRTPLGLYPGPEERPAEAKLRHLGAFEDGVLIACLMLEELGEGRIKMRQVAVDFHRQRSGLGTRLVRFSETVAKAAGKREMVLNAREKAIPFYERLGYAVRGEPFVEVTLPHREMARMLEG
jgi:predicted GNAT family N-acyltransferase